MDDLQLDSGNTLRIFNGDFIVDESTSQNIKLILQYEKGHNRQYPKIGVGLENMTNGILDTKLKNKIQAELKSDNIKIKEIYIEDGNIKVSY